MITRYSFICLLYYLINFQISLIHCVNKMKTGFVKLLQVPVINSLSAVCINVRKIPQQNKSHILLLLNGMKCSNIYNHSEHYKPIITSQNTEQTRLCSLTLAYP
jgi:hypothetical protein